MHSQIFDNPVSNVTIYMFFEQGYLAHFSMKTFQILNMCCVLEIQMEGSMSQHYDSGPSFNLMKCRN